MQMEQENCCFHFNLYLEMKLHPDTLTPNIHHTSHMTTEYSTGINLLFLCRTFSHASIMQPGEAPPMFPEQKLPHWAAGSGPWAKHCCKEHAQPSSLLPRPFLALGAAVAGGALLYTQILCVLLQLPLSQNIMYLHWCNSWLGRNLGI